jgi:hypothetical protein
MPTITRRQARWLEFLASFQPNVVYVQGKYNPADVLSRPPHELPRALPHGLGSPAHVGPQVAGCAAMLLRGSALLNRRMFDSGDRRVSMHEPIATTLHEGALGELGIRVPETSIANRDFPWHEPTQPHERSRTTREQTVQLTLVASVSTKLL